VLGDDRLVERTVISQALDAQPQGAQPR
jgi:hypothetical protein